MIRPTSAPLERSVGAVREQLAASTREEGEVEVNTRDTTAVRISFIVEVRGITKTNEVVEDYYFLSVALMSNNVSLIYIIIAPDNFMQQNILFLLHFFMKSSNILMINIYLS